MSRRRRLLLSCFACSPQWGSEPGVAWNWLLELVENYDVDLITHTCFRDHIEPVLAAAPPPGLTVHYYSPASFGVHPHRLVNSRLFYCRWQLGLRGVVKRLMKTETFDVFHHLTWGTFRFPVFIGGLGVPLVMGPLGGGETAPLRFFKGLPMKVRLFECLRSLTLRWSAVDPLARIGIANSSVILCKTDETRDALPGSARPRAVVASEIGAPRPDVRAGESARFSPGPRRLLFAARLLGWKGVFMAINAVNILIGWGCDVYLDIVGEGPLLGLLTNQVARLGIGARVNLLGKIPREELLSMYGRAHVFLFPSLHDSSGNVVLEALSRGLPVVCLDLGGPQRFLTPRCGVIVDTAGRSREQVESALASAVRAIIEDPELNGRMAEAAAQEASRQTWKARVDDAYGSIGRRLGWQ